MIANVQLEITNRIKFRNGVLRDFSFETRPVALIRTLLVTALAADPAERTTDLVL